MKRGKVNINMYAYQIHDINELVGEIFTGHTVIKSKRRRQPNVIMDRVAAFDIETSYDYLTDESFMYIWQFAVETNKGIAYMVGRTWEQFGVLLDTINRNLDENGESLVVYVHNLSYEFSYLCGIYHLENIFCTGAHKILFFNIGHIYFRCSYQLTNTGLGKLTDQWKVEHGKLSGSEFNYDKTRYPWTPLTDREVKYCINDVIGLIEVIRAIMAYYKDNLLTIPLTKTGYVRRDIKTVFAGIDKEYRGIPKGDKARGRLFHLYKRMDLQPDAALYQILNDAFRGGNTHANRYYAGKIINNVDSDDRCSSYPDVLVNSMFPIRPFKKFGMCSEKNLDTLHAKKVPFIVRVALRDVKLKDQFDPCPYLAYDKCQGVSAPWIDNGRILAAGYLETAITDVDYHILKAHYKWSDLIVFECYTSKYGLLPDPVRNVIMDYYRKKTEYKGLEDKEDEYRAAKENVNSCYGMMATNPVRPELVFDDNTGLFMFDLENFDIDKALYQNKRKAFLPYQWGIWCTAWARYYLQLAIDICGNKFVYTDTDSVKHVHDDRITKELEELNRKIFNVSNRHKAYATDIHGITHYLGVFENDGRYKRFATLGAKKYIYEDDTGIHITIAGVNKKIGAREITKIAEQVGRDPFDLFIEKELTFKEAGGTEITYYYHEPYTVIREGQELTITSNARIKNHEYTLGISDQYEELLNDDFIQFMARKLIEQGTYDIIDEYEYDYAKGGKT